MADGGKGSAPRPYSVDQDTFASNWERIFGKQCDSNKSEDNVNEVSQGSNDSTTK